MNISNLFFALLLGALVPAMADTPTQWQGTSSIQFSGTSTLHDWAGIVTADPFIATVVMDERGQPASVKASVAVKAAKMDTAEAKRDENMHKDMKVTSFPLIVGAFDTPFELKGGKAPATLAFTLTLLGKPHRVDAAISNWSVNDGTASFDLDFDLSLKTCGIKVPSVLFVISVADKVHVHAPVKLVRK
jgi:hypothetical protein